MAIVTVPDLSGNGNVVILNDPVYMSVERRQLAELEEINENTEPA